MSTKTYQNFWQQHWSDGQTAFHLDDIHPDLQVFLPVLSLELGDTVFVPLCGRTLDIGYLLNVGYNVIAIEMVEYAVQQLFNQLSIVPEVSGWKQGKCYRADHLTVYVGNYFDLSSDECAEVSAIYDRAALAAMPYKLQQRYCQHLGDITVYAKQLVIASAFDQTKMQGPPFTITPQHIQQYYGQHYTIELLNEIETIKEEMDFQKQQLDSFIRRTYLLTPD